MESINKFYGHAITDVSEAEEYNRAVTSKQPNTEDSIWENGMYVNPNGTTFTLEELGTWYALLKDVYTPDKVAEELVSKSKQCIPTELNKKYFSNCDIFNEALEVKQIVMPELALEAFRQDIKLEVVCGRQIHFSQPVVRYSTDGTKASVFFSVSGLDAKEDEPFFMNFVIVCVRQ